MDTTLSLLDLGGAVALLLWGVHMVQTGIQRALGPSLRQVLGGALGGRGRAFLAGLAVTAVLQSSTATGLMAASLAAGGFVDLVPALAAMLGANVGTTLIVQALSFDVTRLAPLLVLIGVIGFRRGTATRTRDLGRVAIGLGLMLTALEQLLVLVTPYEDVPSLRMLLGAVATDPLVDILLAAALTWAAHSSVAVVLLIMSLAAQGAVPPQAALALVLGANIGTALNPVLEGARGGESSARRLPLGNLATRLVGAGIALPFLGPIGTAIVGLAGDPGRSVALFHTVFNLAVALLFLPLLGPFAALLKRWLPLRLDAADPSRPIYLDESAREMPAIALAGAAREALRMADVLDAMLRGAQDALLRGDRRRAAEAKRLDDVLDRLNTAVKAYLTSLDPSRLTEADHRRLSEILVFVTNLEHAGDTVERDVLAHAAKRIRRGLAFSAEEAAGVGLMLDRLVSNLRAAAAVLVSNDLRAARQLAAEKEAFRNLEARATASHFARLRSGRIDSVEISALHLDLLRDLKRVNAHLVAAAAYPVLMEQGELLPSRLRLED